MTTNILELFRAGGCLDNEATSPTQIGFGCGGMSGYNKITLMLATFNLAKVRDDLDQGVSDVISSQPSQSGATFDINKLTDFSVKKGSRPPLCFGRVSTDDERPGRVVAPGCSIGMYRIVNKTLPNGVRVFRCGDRHDRDVEEGVQLNDDDVLFLKWACALSTLRHPTSSRTIAMMIFVAAVVAAVLGAMYFSMGVGPIAQGTLAEQEHVTAQDAAGANADDQPWNWQQFQDVVPVGTFWLNAASSETLVDELCRVSGKIENCEFVFSDTINRTRREVRLITLNSFAAAEMDAFVARASKVIDLIEKEELAPDDFPTAESVVDPTCFRKTVSNFTYVKRPTFLQETSMSKLSDLADAGVALVETITAMKGIPPSTDVYDQRETRMLHMQSEKRFVIKLFDDVLTAFTEDRNYRNKFQDIATRDRVQDVIGRVGEFLSNETKANSVKLRDAPRVTNERTWWTLLERFIGKDAGVQIIANETGIVKDANETYWANRNRKAIAVVDPKQDKIDAVERKLVENVLDLRVTYDRKRETCETELYPGYPIEYDWMRWLFRGTYDKCREIYEVDESVVALEERNKLIMSKAMNSLMSEYTDGDEPLNFSAIKKNDDLLSLYTPDSFQKDLKILKINMHKEVYKLQEDAASKKNTFSTHVAAAGKISDAETAAISSVLASKPKERDSHFDEELERVFRRVLLELIKKALNGLSTRSSETRFGESEGESGGASAVGGLAARALVYNRALAIVVVLVPRLAQLRVAMATLAARTAVVETLLADAGRCGVSREDLRTRSVRAVKTLRRLRAVV